MSAPALAAMHIPERQRLLGKWMREADIGIVFAKRGVGKTWFVMMMANALAEGIGLGEWKAGERKRRIIYVDGEMALADTKKRQAIIGITSPDFVYLHHQRLFEATKKTMNIASLETQREISAVVSEGDVLVIDNRSALCRGGEENSNDGDWELILDWLLGLRRRKVTTILVDHAGKNGELRGGSRREDAVDWTIKLTDETEDDEKREKVIRSVFTKFRGDEPREGMPLRWTVTTTSDKLRYSCHTFAGPDALLALVTEGVDSASDCAEMLGVGKGTVSKWAQKLKTASKITISRGKYKPCL